MEEVSQRAWIFLPAIGRAGAQVPGPQQAQFQHGECEDFGWGHAGWVVSFLVCDVGLFLAAVCGDLCQGDGFLAILDIADL
jgi:hypothetical protein